MLFLTKVAVFGTKYIQCFFLLRTGHYLLNIEAVENIARHGYIKF